MKMKIGEIAWTNIRVNRYNPMGPVLTIGVRVAADCLYVTYSACSPKDAFSKKKARRVVEGRLGDDDKLSKNRVWRHEFDSIKDHILRSEALFLGVSSFLNQIDNGNVQISWLKKNVISGLLKGRQA